MQSLTTRRGDIAVAAMAAKSKAEVEARYVIALQRPRNVLDTRNAILESCKRPAFCEGAIYRKPVGGSKTVDGFSIRFAEEAIKALKNVAVDTMAIYEDDERLTIRISVTDLESNLTYADEARITKTVERRQLKEGQSAISERMNSTGQKVYLVAATDDDLLNKINAAKSKAIRNSGLRLIPQDILEEAWSQILETMRKGGADPKAATKKVCDSFSTLNITPSELERFLGHSLETVSPVELQNLRGIYTAIKEEETSWKSVMETAAPKRPVKEGPGDDGDLGPQDPAATAKKAQVVSETSAAIDAEAIPKPYEKIVELAKADGVSLEQVHAFMKKSGLAGEKTDDLFGTSDANMRTVIGTWKAVLGKIRSTTVK